MEASRKFCCTEAKRAQELRTDELTRQERESIYSESLHGSNSGINELLFGRFAAQSPLTVYEPNAPVEVSCAEVTTTLMLSRRGSIASSYNSGDEIDTCPTKEISSAGCQSQISATLPTFANKARKRQSFSLMGYLH